VLDANDGYVLGRPRVGQIEVKFVIDTNTLVANLIAGALNMTLGRGLNAEQVIVDDWRRVGIVGGKRGISIMAWNAHKWDIRP
jgi:hypothetical protein